MDGRFLTAFIIPKKWEIMGYTLKPFSLRHMLILHAIDSPFVSGKSVPTHPEQVLACLRICSGLHPDDAFKKRVSWLDSFRAARLQLDSKYFVEVVSSIMEYMQICASSPQVYTKPDTTEKRAENVPGPLSLATSLMSKLHMKPDEAWEMTLGQTIWYLTAHAISEGADIKILTTAAEAKADTEREALLKHNAEVLAKVKELRRNKPNG
jgi:hypothetical protein